MFIWSPKTVLFDFYLVMKQGALLSVKLTLLLEYIGWTTEYFSALITKCMSPCKNFCKHDFCI